MGGSTVQEHNTTQCAALEERTKRACTEGSHAQQRRGRCDEPKEETAAAEASTVIVPQRRGGGERGTDEESTANRREHSTARLLLPPRPKAGLHCGINSASLCLCAPIRTAPPCWRSLWPGWFGVIALPWSRSHARA